MAQIIDCIKVTLKTKKVVTVRNPLIRDQDAALQMAAAKVKDNHVVLAMTAQKEMLKLLLLEVDGLKLSRTDAEQLDKYFTLDEYNQLMQFMGQLSGGSSSGEFLTEIVTSGEQ